MPYTSGRSIAENAFYASELAPLLPEAILDFHTHVWARDQWLNLPADEGANSAAPGSHPNAKYMTTLLDYTTDDLLADANRMFPGRAYNAVIFGNPTPSADTEKTNALVARSARPELFPLMVVGRDRMDPVALREQIIGAGFFGYKVLLDWVGDDYGSHTIEDMIGPAEMRIANELGLIVVLHVPRSERLADPEVQRGVIDYAQRYPNARIVLAHCGRCYLPREIMRAIGSIRSLENVYMDTAMVMDPLTLRIVFENIDSRRVLFATDYPVAAMRGRRVYASDHWVDLVSGGYPESDFRVGSDNFRAAYMAHEIVAAIALAAELAGLSAEETKGVFHGNGMSLLARSKPTG